MNEIRSKLQSSRNNLNGSLSTLSYALEQSDDALVNYMDRYGDSVLLDLLNARRQLDSVMLLIQSTKAESA